MTNTWDEIGLPMNTGLLPSFLNHRNYYHLLQRIFSGFVVALSIVVLLIVLIDVTFFCSISRWENIIFCWIVIKQSSQQTLFNHLKI